MSNLGVWKIAQAEPDRLAIVDADGGETSYGDLAALTNRYVHGLRARGLETGDVVAVLLPNGPQLLALFLAVLQGGFYIVPVNWHLVGPEVGHILEDSGAKVFICDERFGDVGTAGADIARVPAEGRFSVGHLDGFAPVSDLTDGQPTSAPEGRTAGAPMQYTSGTTGRPKGVRRALTGSDPETVSARNAGFLSLFGIRPYEDNVHICGSPMYHTAVLVWASGSVSIGHTVVLMDKWSPEEMLRLIDTYKVTQSHMVPTQFSRLLSLPDEVKQKYDLSSLRSMVHGAAPCPNETKQRMIDWWGPVLLDYYAATEGGGTLITSEEWLKKPGSVGRPWPNSEVTIFDDDGNEQPVNVPGQVFMRMGGSDFEYYKDKEKTAASRMKGYFTVGDIGYIDEDGYLFLCDRKSDMIISGGVNVYPAEIEGELSAHPKIADVAVFGIPHADWGEEIKAVVLPTDDVSPSDQLSADILAFAAERLAKFKLPRSVDYVTEMPRDPNGKLYKRKLRDPYWEGKERAI
jgi:long-chain acyl-CoA synthetase